MKNVEEIQLSLSKPIKSSDIEVRVQSTNNNRTVILFYKDARCDMKMLDEAVGALNWKREHHLDQKGKQFCTVSIRNPETGEWVGKSDTGSESNTEKEKGLVSDAFKRACFNWGIGRILYDMPTCFVKGTHKYVSHWTVDYGINSETGAVAYVVVSDPRTKDSEGKPTVMFKWADRSVDRKKIVRC